VTNEVASLFVVAGMASPSLRLYSNLVGERVLLESYIPKELGSFVARAFL
jgi:hypothetical protein